MVDPKAKNDNSGGIAKRKRGRPAHRVRMVQVPLKIAKEIVKRGEASKISIDENGGKKAEENAETDEKSSKNPATEVEEILVLEQQNKDGDSSKLAMAEEEAAEEEKQQQQEGLIPASQFKWDQYLEQRAGQRALDGHLFQHQHFAERTLGEQIFRPGRLVHVHHRMDGGNSQLLKGRILVTIQEEALVEINWAGPAIPAPMKPKWATEMPNASQGLPPAPPPPPILPWHKNSPSIQKEEPSKSTKELEKVADAISAPCRAFFSLDELELAPMEGDGAKWEGAQMMSAEEWASVNVEYANFLTNSDMLSSPLHTFIQPGQFIELHDARNANLIHLARVGECASGMISVEFGPEQKELIHFCSERCHPVGWTERENAKLSAALIDHDQVRCHHRPYELKNALKNVPMPIKKAESVPAWLFTFRPLQQHRFEVGMMLEMLDPINRLTFVPAFVSEICSPHFFKVRPIRNVALEGAPAFLPNQTVEEYLRHRCSPDLLPVGWCFKNKLRLDIPEGMMKGRFSNDSNLFSYVALRNRLAELMGKGGNGNNNKEEGGQPAAFKFANDALFELPKMLDKKLDCIRYCEVPHANISSYFLPAAILRCHRHFIWVQSANSLNGPHNLPQIHSISSLELFRIGSARQFPNFHILTVPVRIPRELAVERRRLEEKYSSKRGCIVLPNTKAFMPKIWLQGDLWLPPIHLNISCFPGPFLCAEKLACLSRQFGPGPLPHMLKQLFRAIILCAQRPKELAGMLAIVHPNATHSPLMMMKMKHRERRIMTNVEICSTAAQFPGWLVMLLIRLDACPNLFSLEMLDVDAPNVDCPFHCAESMAQRAYMQTTGHPQMATSSTLQSLSNKFNNDIKQLNRQMARIAKGEEPRRKPGPKPKKTTNPMECGPSGSRGGGGNRLMKTRAGTKAAVKRDNLFATGGGVRDKKRIKLSENVQPMDPEMEMSQESQCSTATTQSSSQPSSTPTSPEGMPTAAALDQMLATTAPNSSTESPDEYRGIVTPPPLLPKKTSHKKRTVSDEGTNQNNNKGSRHLSQLEEALEKYMGAKMPLVRMKRFSGRAGGGKSEAEKKMMREAEIQIKRMAGGGGRGDSNEADQQMPPLDRRVGMVPPYHHHVQKNKQQKQQQREFGGQEEGGEGGQSQQRMPPSHQPTNLMVAPGNPFAGEQQQQSTQPQQVIITRQLPTTTMFDPSIYGSITGFPSAPNSSLFQHHHPQQFFSNDGQISRQLQDYHQQQQQREMQQMNAGFYPFSQPIGGHFQFPPQQFGPTAMMFGGGGDAGNHQLAATKYATIGTNPTEWSCEQLAEWIGQSGQREIANRLKNEDVDGASFLLFTVDTFRKQMRLNLGPAVKMNDLVETLKIAVANFQQQPSTSAAATANSGGGGQNKQ